MTELFRDDTSSLRVLTINGGSSSIKFALFEMGALVDCIFRGSIGSIGSADATLQISGVANSDNSSQSVSVPNHIEAVAVVADWILSRGNLGDFAAIGHRVVHGGPNYSEPQRITLEMVQELRRLRPFDPEHLPEELLLIEAFTKRFPDVPQVACFDTAFHRFMPRVAQMLPIPRRYEAKGVRRYGFHGLSYEYLMEQLNRVVGCSVAQGKVVLAHLGSGASLAAVHHGKPVDTSMGFTPSSGVSMATRSGDLDPGLFGYLAQTENMSAEKFNDMINSDSGLLGVSETSSDMRQLLRTEARDARAAEAVALFCYQIKKCIGAFAAVLGGLDTVVFTGGIGENAATVRARICEGLGFLGIELDDKLNAQHENVISATSSRVEVRVIHTDEEHLIAQKVHQIWNLEH